MQWPCSRRRARGAQALAYMVLLGNLASGCRRSGSASGSRARDEPEPRSTTEAAGIDDAAPQPCTAPGASPRAARELATLAARQHGFPEDTEPPTLSSDSGYVLSPLLPVSWPPTPCVARYYVYHRSYWGRSTESISYGGVEAAIDIDLRTGEVRLARIEDGPGGDSGDRDLMPRQSDTEMFLVIVGRRPSKQGDFAGLREWVQVRSMAAPLWVWHREFVEWLVDGDTTGVLDSKSIGEAWSASHPNHPPPDPQPLQVREDHADRDSED